MEEGPLLRGLVKVEGDELVWGGKWAFGKEGHAEKKTNKFSLRAPLSTTQGLADGKVVSDTTITFNGFFKLTKGSNAGEEQRPNEDQKVVKVKEENVKVRFLKQDGKAGFDIRGTGTNKFGDFTIVGSYSGDKNQMWARKEYEDEEFSDDGGDNDGGSDGSEDEYGSGDGMRKGEGDVDDDIASELADLREDAAFHNIALDETRGGSVGRQGSARSGKGAKRRSEDQNENVAALQKKNKIISEWNLERLKASQSRLKLMADSGEIGGILMVLDELKSGGSITVALLQETGVGRDVRSLKQHGDSDVATRASEIVDMWKAMVR